MCFWLETLNLDAAFVCLKENSAVPLNVLQLR